MAESARDEPQDDAAAATAVAGSGHDEQPAQQAADEADSPAPPDRVKSAFAAAVEKKKAAGQARTAHLDANSAVGGATANHKATRTFRRKSG